MPNDRTDLNLFRVFDAILAHGSLAGAARELGLSASAASHALARLRSLLRDELFRYGKGGMTPTARARAIAPEIRSALKLLAAAIDEAPFEPAGSQRSFQIGASDGVSAVVLPPLLAHLQRVAPGIHLRIVPVGRLDLVQQLDDGRLDFVVGWYDALPDRVCRRRLYEEREAMVVRPGHKLATGALTPERLLAFPHLVVDFTGTEALSLNGFYNDRGVLRRTWMDCLVLDSLDPVTAEQKVLVTLSSYGAVGPVVRATDMVATVPLRLARRMAAEEKLIILDLPYDPVVVNIEAAWHERSDADAGLTWLIETIVSVLQEGAASGS